MEARTKPYPELEGQYSRAGQRWATSAAPRNPASFHRASQRLTGQTIETLGREASESGTWSHRRDVLLCEAGPGLGGDPISFSVWSISACNEHTAPGRRVGVGMALLPALDSAPVTQLCTSLARFVQQTFIGGQLSTGDVAMSSVNKALRPLVYLSLASAHGASASIQIIQMRKATCREVERQT